MTDELVNIWFEFDKGKGNDLNQLNNPMGILFNGDSLLIADTGNDRIMKWRFGATEGELVVGGNGRGSALNQLNQPFGMAVDGDSIFVSDTFNNRIMRWRFGAKNGELVAGGNG